MGKNENHWRTLREKADKARAKEDWKAALELYTELEEADPQNADWLRKRADCHRRLGQTEKELEALIRCADKYASTGFLVKAIAVCKVILALSPEHTATQERLAALHARRPLGLQRMPVRAVSESHAKPATSSRAPQPEPAVRNTGATRGVNRRANLVDMLKRAGLRPPPGKQWPSGPASVPRDESSPASGQELDFEEPSSQPIFEPQDSLDSLPLSQMLVGSKAVETSDSSPHVYELHLEDLEDLEVVEEASASGGPEEPAAAAVAQAQPITEQTQTQPSVPPQARPLYKTLPGEDEPGPADFESVVMALDHLEAEPSSLDSDGELAELRASLEAVPLFSDLHREEFSLLLEGLEVIQLEPAGVLFRQGDDSTSMFVVAEGCVEVLVNKVEVAVLGEGEFFGELGLLTSDPRSATVQSQGGAELLCFDRANLFQLIEQKPAVLRKLLRFLKARLVETFLNTSPLMTTFPFEERESLMQHFKLVEIEADSEVISQGTPASGLYVLLSGGAKVVQTKGGKTVTLASLTPGTVCGEMSLLHHQPAIATVRTARKLFALFVSAKDFRTMIMTHPTVLEFVGEVAEKRAQANAQGTQLSAASVTWA